MHVGSSWTTDLGKMHGHIKSLFDRNRAGQTLGKAHLDVGSIVGISAREKGCKPCKEAQVTHGTANNLKRHPSQPEKMSALIMDAVPRATRRIPKQKTRRCLRPSGMMKHEREVD